MRACILSIGDELVLGQTVDTNSAWLSQQLATVGCDVGWHQTVGDGQSDIERAIRLCVDGFNVLLISGGIGPTADDLTRQALAAVMGTSLELNQTWLDELNRFFSRASRPMPQTNVIQAMIPRGAQMIFNTCGTAAGIQARIGTCDIFAMPGVPREMKAMFARDVLPHIRSAAGGACILSRTLHTFGIGESAVAERLDELMRRDRNPSVGTTVSAGIVSLRLNVRSAPEASACAQLDETEQLCRAAMGDLIYGQDEQTLAQVVAQMLFNHPVAQQWSPAVATAESCTGGLLAKMLTDIAGSSRYFRQGWVTYDNEAKQDELNVPGELIATHGAVSEPVSRAMAEGAQTQSGAYYALSITGIAGPGGGTPEKPVGTVWIALRAGSETNARHFLFNYGDRDFIRDRAAKMALTMLRFHLLNKPLPF